MNKSLETFRILALAPSTRGVGFVLLEGQDTLADWGIRTVKGDQKNVKALAKVKELITRYQPSVLVLEDASATGSRRSPRIRILGLQIVKLAGASGVKVKLYARDQVMKTFISDGDGTKHALAEIIAKKFSEQLGPHLPPKRKPWNSENYQMSVFDAAALALVFRMKKPRRTA